MSACPLRVLCGPKILFVKIIILLYRCTVRIKKHYTAEHDIAYAYIPRIPLDYSDEFPLFSQ